MIDWKAFLEKHPYSLRWSFFKGWRIFHQDDFFSDLGWCKKNIAINIVMLMNCAYHSGMIDSAAYINSLREENLEELESV